MRSYVNHFKQAIGSFFDFRYVFGNRLDRACPTWSGAMRHTFFQRSKLKTNKNFTSQPKNTKRKSEFTTKILANLISFHLLGAFFMFKFLRAVWRRFTCLPSQTGPAFSIRFLTREMKSKLNKSTGRVKKRRYLSYTTTVHSNIYSWYANVAGAAIFRHNFRPLLILMRTRVRSRKSRSFNGFIQAWDTLGHFCIPFF